MKLSTKTISGKIRLLVKNVSDKFSFVIGCCCGDAGLLLKFTDCCNDTVDIYVPFSVIDETRCVDTIRYNNVCFRRTDTTITQAEAIKLGYQIVTDAAQIQCARCQSAPCPQCPEQCCKIVFVPGSCEDEIAQNIENWECCNRGTEYTMAAFKVNRQQYRSFTSVNGSGDYCPAGCTDGLENFYRNYNESESWNGIYRNCDNECQRDGTSDCTRDYVRTEELLVTRYGFNGGVAGQTCFQSVETPTFVEYRDNYCNTVPYPEDLLPGPYIIPAGIGNESEALVCEFNGVRIYDNVPGYRRTCTYTLTRNRGCYSGQFQLQIDCITKIHPSAPPETCPPPNTVTAISTDSYNVGYSLQPTSYRCCDRDYCGSQPRPAAFTRSVTRTGALSLL